MSDAKGRDVKRCECCGRFGIMNRRLLVSIALGACTILWTVATAQKKSAPAAPLLAVLDQFTAPGIPAHGPSEQSVERNWPEPTTPPDLPGQGLAQHPMLYAGEGHNTIFLVNHGKV